MRHTLLIALIALIPACASVEGPNPMLSATLGHDAQTGTDQDTLEGTDAQTGTDQDAGPIEADVPPPKCPTNCDDGEACTTDSCNKGTGNCIHAAVANQTPCLDDGEACTADGCVAGKCGHLAKYGNPCTDDGNVCTDDKCGPDKTGAGKCLHEPNTAACDDGLSCTTGDHCDAGKCRAGSIPDCDDADPCTTDACDAVSGKCQSIPSVLCDDGNPCTTGDSCTTGKCIGAATDCDDGEACTTDKCDTVQGCQHKSTTCEAEGEACTTVQCIPCMGDKNCDDANPCTADFCNPNTGKCEHTAVDDEACKTICAKAIQQNSNKACLDFCATNCDDADPCTADFCSTLTEMNPDGCKHFPLSSCKP